MKWLLTRSGDVASVYPEKDILPHRHDPNCPCRPVIVRMYEGDSIGLHLEEDEIEEVFIAPEELDLIMHTPVFVKLKESTN